MAFKQPPLTPIPSGVQKTDPQLYEYLKRLEDLVRRLTKGVEDAQAAIKAITP